MKKVLHQKKAYNAKKEEKGINVNCSLQKKETDSPKDTQDFCAEIWTAACADSQRTEYIHTNTQWNANLISSHEIFGKR